MYLNAERISVYQWNHVDKSVCPDCGGELTARMGSVNVWHWAHKSKGGGNVQGCYTRETKWHLTWKDAYHKYKKWEIEHPVRINGRSYRIDAANPDIFTAREFVHSLSSDYVAKHHALSNLAGWNVLWLFDGEEFVSKLVIERISRNGKWYAKRFLKPRAAQLFEDLGGRMKVHWKNHIWTHWRNGAWFPGKSDPLEKFQEITQAANIVWPD